MKRFRVIGLCIGAILALSALTATSAWAQEAPEIGRCVSHAKGKYINNVCTKKSTAKTAGSFEWESGAIKNKFAGTGGVGTLETVHAAKVTCKTEASSGDMTSSKAVGNVEVTFTGCELVGFKCSTKGAAEGEIVTNLLSGTLVWEKYKTKVAIDLVPQSGEWFVEFMCGPGSAKVKGSVLAPLPVDKAESTLEEKFSAKKGKQKPEYYYTSATTKVKDVLFSKLGGPEAELEQSGQTITNDQVDEEVLEINTTV
jgi:hypothetical protein